AAEVLALHAGRLVPLLERAGFIDDADGAGAAVGELRQGLGQAALEFVAQAEVVPGGGGEELLEGADGGAGDQGDRLDRPCGQVGEQPAAEVAEVPGRALLGEEAPEAAKVAGERRPEISNLLLRHPIPSGSAGGNHRN